MRRITQQCWHQLWFTTGAGAAVAVGLKGGSAISTVSPIDEI